MDVEMYFGPVCAQVVQERKDLSFVSIRLLSRRLQQFPAHLEDVCRKEDWHDLITLVVKGWSAPISPQELQTSLRKPIVQILQRHAKRMGIKCHELFYECKPSSSSSSSSFAKANQDQTSSANAPLLSELYSFPELLRQVQLECGRLQQLGHLPSNFVNPLSHVDTTKSDFYCPHCRSSNIRTWFVQQGGLDEQSTLKWYCYDCRRS